MVDEPVQRVAGSEFDKLREKFTEERVRRFLPTLGQIEDANWNKPITVPIDDAIFEFRKFTHGEVSLLTSLPYYSRLDKLNEKEAADFQIVKRLMVERIATEPGRWMELSKTEPKWIDAVFNAILSASLVDVKKLQEFFGSDFGWSYGLIWFLNMRKTPTEVAAMSEGDYQSVLAFFTMNHERIWGKK